MFKRLQTLPGRGRESCFLWGPRQTGKSTLLKKLFPNSLVFDLLLSDQFERLLRRPELMREEILSAKHRVGPVMIDEIQKIPALLDDVQWLIVNQRIPFILCGSSARKLKRSGANLLGGRALRYELFPLVSSEIDDFDLNRAINHGLIPRHYLHENPAQLIRAYIGDYLREEIAQEGIVRNLPSFGRFLEAASFSNGGVPVFKNIAQDCGVSEPTVKEYFKILEDTLIARFLPSFQKRPKRRVIQSPKFYYFDVGLANSLLKREGLGPGDERFGFAFEHFLFQELAAHRHYSGKDYPLAYWQTTSQLEVDFILGDPEVAIEAKAVKEVSSRHLKGLQAFREEYSVRKAIIVSLDKAPRKMGPIDVLPWKDFLSRLWGGEIL